MKEKIKKFINNNSLTIPMYISLACIAIWDFTIALVIYAVVMHFLLLVLILGLYYPNVIKKPTAKSGRLLSIKRTLFMAAHTFVVTIILVITEHWYVLCVALLCIFLVSAYLEDWAKDTPAE